MAQLWPSHCWSLKSCWAFGFNIKGALTPLGALPSPLQFRHLRDPNFTTAAVQVDDFLFVTPILEHAVSFVTLMQRGIPEYNCRINAAKTLVNFAIEEHSVGPVPQLAPGALFPWCGLLIDPSTLAIVADYTRYSGVVMSDTLTV